jgi:hypothetical protein
MPSLLVLKQLTQTISNITGTTYGDPIPLNGAMTVAVQSAVDVNTPSNKTFAAAAVDIGTDTITLTAHGYPTGLKVQISNPGTLPTGISPTTDYFVISLTANTFQLASTLADAIATPAVPIDISAQGSGTNTVGVTALAGANVKLQVTNDPNTPDASTIWSDVASATSITVDANFYLSQTMSSTVPPTGNWTRIAYTLTAGSLSTVNEVVVKGFA